MALKQKITTFLCFDMNAEAAVRHYTSIFRNSRIVDVMRCVDAGPYPKGTVLTITFELEGQPFIALNGGPQYKFTEAISLFVSCETQAEIDALWDRLCEGGAPSQCGWLKDKFGLSWQIAPSRLLELLSDKDAGRASRAMQAMMQMSKIDLAAVERAAADK